MVVNFGLLQVTSRLSSLLASGSEVNFKLEPVGSLHWQARGRARVRLRLPTEWPRRRGRSGLRLTRTKCQCPCIMMVGCICQWAGAHWQQWQVAWGQAITLRPTIRNLSASHMTRNSRPQLEGDPPYARGPRAPSACVGFERARGKASVMGPPPIVRLPLHRRPPTASRTP